MTEFPIDDDIKIPEVRPGSGRRGEVRSAMERLQVGQSFFVPHPAEADSEKHGIKISGTVGRLRKAIGEERIFATRQWEEKGVKGVRIWRTK